MGKLYVIAIGGTGSRVLKSMTMLLAAGVNVPNITQIVPVVVDLDNENGNMSETTELLNLYKDIQTEAKTNLSDGFFKTDIGYLPNSTSYHLNLNRNKHGDEKLRCSTFNEFIDYDRLQLSNKNAQYLVDLLYTPDNLTDKLEIGFQGQPNIGAVTFYNIVNADSFKKLCSSFTLEDRVFFVSSIFGGTGASGFPTLLKILRDSTNGLDNSNIRSQLKVGALVVLPYFKLEDTTGGKKKIDSDTFMTKTLIALSYYDKYLEGYNALYYLSEPNSRRLFANNIGGSDQKNESHFIEMMGALSVLNFAQTPEEELQTVQHYEYKLSEDMKDKRITFNDMSDKSSEQQVPFANYITRFAYMYKYFFNSSNKDLSNGQDWRKQMDLKLKEQGTNFETFERTKFMINLKKFLDTYSTWMRDIAKGNKGELRFEPLNIDATDTDLEKGKFLLHKDIPYSGKGFMGALIQNNPIYLKQFNTVLNDKDEMFLKEFSNPCKHLLSLFDIATKEIFNNHI